MMEKYNIEETMAFTGHRLIEPGRVEDIKAQLRIKIKALYAKGIRIDRKSTRLNSSHVSESRMPSSA